MCGFFLWPGIVRSACGRRDRAGRRTRTATSRVELPVVAFGRVFAVVEVPDDLFVDGAEGAGRRGITMSGVPAGAWDDDGLLVEGVEEVVEEVVDQPVGHSGCSGAGPLRRACGGRLCAARRGSVAFQQPGDGVMVQTRAQLPNQMTYEAHAPAVER